jgi:hypothetical protein
MKNRSDPYNVPQIEGHPEPFPEVTTMPKGWDLSELVAPQAVTFESIQNAIPLELDSRAAAEDRLA